MFTKKWFQDTYERVLRTGLQVYLATWLAISGHDFQDLWSHQVVLVTVGSAAATLLTCVTASKIGSDQDASFQKISS